MRAFSYFVATAGPWGGNEKPKSFGGTVAEAHVPLKDCQCRLPVLGAWIMSPLADSNRGWSVGTRVAVEEPSKNSKRIT